MALTPDSVAAQTQWLDATAQAELVASGELSAVDLLDAAVERIEAFDGPVNAVIIRWFEHAREVAAANPTGPFAGVPFRSTCRCTGTKTGFRSACSSLLPTAERIS